MKKILLLLICLACLITFAACSYRGEAAPENTGDHTVSAPSPTAEEAQRSSAEAVDIIEVYSARMWNEFAESYNGERERYADHVTVKIIGELDFDNMDFIPLADGFSGKISAADPVLEEEEWRLWISERKKWPLDHKGTFINISSVKDADGKKATCLFGDADELELENVSFAFVRLSEIKCLFTENADSLKLRNVRVQNCALQDGRSIAAVNVGNISAERFIAESCMLTGYEYMGGIVCFVSDEAQFKDIFLCRCSFVLSPDNGGSGLWSAGIGLLAKSVNGTASFEDIDIYGCSSSGLYTDALANSVGEVSKCSGIALDFCTFMNYRPMGSGYNSGMLGSCGELKLMDLPAFEENISVTNCNIGGEYTEADFEDRGYFVENCVFVSSKETPPQ